MATIASIQNLLTKEDCEKILKRSSDFPIKLISYKLTKFHENVVGFLGDHLTLTIKFSSNSTTSQVTYFVKTLPQFNNSQLDYVSESGIFKKEVLLYQNLLSELLKIHQFGPKCYFITDKLIVLEDLKARGFKMYPKELYITEDRCIGMLKNLARFHSSTIIFEQKRGFRLDQKFAEEIKETCFCFTEGQARQKWLVSATRCVTDLMKLIFEDIDSVCEKFHRFVFEELQEAISPSKRFRNVLTHDDLWCNNMLFNDKNECLFIDFQLVRYVPPCMDFLTCLYLNLEANYVENNIKTFTDIYYSFLEEGLKSYNLDSSELPKNQFEDSLEWYKLPALTEAVMYGTHVYTSEELCNEIVADLTKYNEFSFINRSKFAVKEFRDNKRYRERITPKLTLLVKALINRPKV